MTSAKIEVAEVIRSVSGGREVHWIPNSGNAGDALIAAGTVHLFQDHGIECQVVEDTDRFDGTGKIVCYGGGGNLVPQYQTARNILLRHHRAVKHLIVLPHTIAGHDDLLAEFGPNVTIICRESVSFAHCRRAAPRAEVLAADDLALSVQPARLPWSASSVPGSYARARYERAREKYITFLAAGRAKNELDVFRNDSERDPRATSPPGNDMSRLFQPQGHRLVDKMIAAHFFLQAIASFDAIRTDRLHVAIAGTLLGKQVTLYPNSYYKNRAVYAFSLRKFSNVRFAKR